MTNLIHWMVLHSPLTVAEHHHHDQLDLFPDYHRQVLAGTGTSVFTIYRLPCAQRHRHGLQFVVYVTEKYLCGELRAQRPLAVNITLPPKTSGLCARRRGVPRGQCGAPVWDKRTGNTLSRQVRQNHARVYDESFLPGGRAAQPAAAGKGSAAP